MVALWVGRCGFNSVSTTLSHKATLAVLGSIRKRVCEKLSRVPLGTVLDMPSGSVKNVLVERVDSIETTMAHIIPEFTSNLLVTVPIAKLVAGLWDVDGGKIVQSGTYEQLMERGGLYRRFVESCELAVGWKV